MKKKVCDKCHGEYDLIFFWNDLRVTRNTQNRNKCIGCVQTMKDKNKQYNRPLAKARNAYYSHAKKFIERGLINNREELEYLYGWDVHQMAHDIEHAYKNGCPYCHQPFSEMDGGLSAVTLDIVDPNKPPFYTTNVRWVCATDNKEKQRTPPELWALKLLNWDRWHKIQDGLSNDPFFDLPLFKGRIINKGQMRLGFAS